jgi:uncharacterized SAM-binding protein YcdF (DUF218 family)
VTDPFDPPEQVEPSGPFDPPTPVEGVPEPGDPTPPGGVVFVPQERARNPWRIARRVGYVVVALLVVYYAATLFWVHKVGQSDQARPVDAIVVMGAAQYDGRPSKLLAARLDHALELYQDGYAPLIVTTGGNRPGDRFTEAETSANYLIERGVPAEAIIQVAGENSYESLELASNEVRFRGLHSVLLVSDPYHMLRTRLIAQELGLTAYVSPTRTSPMDADNAFWHEMKEAGGVAIGRLIGFERLVSLTG